jgi:hypothetical protein
MTMTRWLTASVVGGVLLAIGYAVTPLTIVVALAAVIVLPSFASELPRLERRWLSWILVAALAARSFAVGALVIRNMPSHDDQFVGAASGDEAYVMGRALRTRAILVGAPTTKYDFFVAYDEYGRNSFVAMVTALQLLLGPTPYSLRLLNALVFVTGALLLFRLVHRTLGPPAAFGGLLVLLFWPTLFAWSISLLKEPLYFFSCAVVLSAAVSIVRAPTWRARLGWLGAAVGAALLMRDLRTGAIALAAAGVGVGVALWCITASRVAAAVAIATVVGIIVTVGANPRVEHRIFTALEAAAKIQAGHVFTVGHAYKVLDPLFYARPATPAASRLELLPDEAGRYLVRAAASFVIVPLPWQLESTRELAYLPEQIAWYVLVLLLPVGAVAAARRDRLVSCMLIGFVLPTAAVLALTNGNVGTLLRMRGLVVPYLVWPSAAGFAALIETAERKGRMRYIDEQGRVFGRVNLFDAALIAFAIVLVPLAYATYLLFRTPALQITSVTRVPITREERRVAGGSLLAAKIKLRGNGLRPLLRASIDDTPALALVFENPHSADILVGEVPPGTHDLILYDGVQEVGRAPKSVTIQPEPTEHVLVVGTLAVADRTAAEKIAVGPMVPTAEIVKLGAVRADPTGEWQRDAEIRFECEPDPTGEGCSVAGTRVGAPHPPLLHISAGSGTVWSFAVRDVLPATPAQPATARVQLSAPDAVLKLVRAGARDDCLDDRAAVVAATGATRTVGTGPALDATLKLGLDRSADGWNYRGRTFKAGAPFTLATEQYVVAGVVLSVDVNEGASR